MVRDRGSGVLTGERVSSRKEAPTAKAPLGSPRWRGLLPLTLGFVPIGEYPDLVNTLVDAEDGCKYYRQSQTKRPALDQVVAF